MKKPGFFARLFAKQKPLKRGFFAAQSNRLTADWAISVGQIDSDLRGDLVALRGRARELCKTNDYAEKYLRLLKQNVVGSEGFSLQVKSFDWNKDKNGKYYKSFDEVANRIIEEEFWKWGDRKWCDVTGKMSFRQMQNVLIETVARDGEVFVKLIRNRRLNDHSFSLQLIPADYIDHQQNEELKDGNYIRMGIEHNSAGAVVAYHIIKAPKTTELWATTPTGEKERIPAEDMIHLFYQKHPIQTRGYSWYAPSMWKMWQLGKFEEASVVNARVSAAKMGFFKDGTGEGMDGEYSEENGETIDQVDPGQFTYIGNRDFVSFDPKFPTDQYASFTKSMLRAIASGMGVSYNTLCNDLEGVNYSSIRAGLLDERAFYKEIQGWFKEQFLNQVFSEWLKLMLLNPNIKLPAEKFEKFNNFTFIPRGWQWVDPYKDMQANKLAIEQGLRTRQQIIAEQGGDFLETMEALKYEQQIIQEYGITIGETNGTEKASGTSQNGASLIENDPGNNE